MNLFRSIVTAAALAGLALGAAACDKPKAQPPKEVIRPVVTVTVQAPAATRERSFSGVAKAVVETRLSFRVSGEITKLPAKIGVRVKPGDLIAQLDPTDYQLKEKQLLAELRQVRAKLKQADSNYDRVRELYEVGSSTKSDLDAAQANYESGLAASESIQRNLDLARKQLEYCTLTAPMAGSIATVPVEVHQTVQAGEVVAALSSDRQIEVELGVPEKIVGLLKPGDLARVAFDSLPGESLDAKVAEVGVQTGASSAYPVKLRLAKSDTRVRPGMVCEATFELPPAPGQSLITVPPVAVVGDPGGKRTLWVYDPEAKVVRKRQVEVGDLTSRGLTIKSGLTPGEIVVTRGVHSLEDGQKVRLMNGQAGN